MSRIRAEFFAARAQRHREAENMTLFSTSWRRPPHWAEGCVTKYFQFMRGKMVAEIITT